MRLTLRTLLAYLDDRLDPADAKAIGAKIAESPVAPGMIDRIREVLRRRRVSAPHISGPGSGPDPNLVAEYLDLTLPPEHVAEIERICLESDIHLAEVAATHQVLTLVLGEAVEIPPAMRERMYTLGIETAPPPEGNGHARERVVAAAAPERGAGASRTAVAHDTSPFAGRLPPEFQRRPLWKRLLPIAVPLVLIGWLYLVLRDFSGGVKPPGRGAPAVSHTDPAGSAAPASPDALDAGPVEAEASPTADGSTPVTVVDAPPTGQAEPETESVPVDTTTPDATTVAAVPSPEPPPAPAPDPAPVPAVAAEAPVDPVSIQYNSVEGVLLHYRQEDDDWTVMPRRALIHPGDRLACPEPFTAQMSVAEGRCGLTLNSGTAADVLPPARDAALRLAVGRGRVGLFLADAPGPMPCVVRVGSKDYRLELLEEGTLCGVEVIPRPCQGVPPGPPVPHFDGGLFVASGAVLVTRPDGQELMLRPDSGWLPWQSAGAAEPGPLLAVPQWLTPGGPSLPAIHRTYATQYEREFVLDEPISYSIPAVVKDRRPRMSEFAVQTLALTDNYRQLLRALQAEHSESRRAAIMGLRQWLPQSPDHGPLLFDEIGRVFRDADVETVYTLLWGFTEDAARDPAVSEKLVSWLAHDEVAVRELAIKSLLDLTGRDYDFHPTAPLVQRQAAIARWMDHLRRNGALEPLAAGS